MVFTEDTGKTTVTQTVLYSSQAARDGALKLEWSMARL
jgi:hypothetical protein